MVIPDAAFSAVRLCSYALRSTIGLLSDSQASCFLLFSAAFNSNELRYSGGKSIMLLINYAHIIMRSSACQRYAECKNVGPSIASLKFNLHISRHGALHWWKKQRTLCFYQPENKWRIRSNRNVRFTPKIIFYNARRVDNGTTWKCTKWKWLIGLHDLEFLVCQFHIFHIFPVLFNFLWSVVVRTWVFS